MHDTTWWLLMSLYTLVAGPLSVGVGLAIGLVPAAIAMVFFVGWAMISWTYHLPFAIIKCFCAVIKSNKYDVTIKIFICTTIIPGMVLGLPIALSIAIGASFVLVGVTVALSFAVFYIFALDKPKATIGEIFSFGFDWIPTVLKHYWKFYKDHFYPHLEKLQEYSGEKYCFPIYFLPVFLVAHITATVTFFLAALTVLFFRFACDMCYTIFNITRYAFRFKKSHDSCSIYSRILFILFCWIPGCGLSIVGFMVAWIISVTVSPMLSFGIFIPAVRHGPINCFIWIIRTLHNVDRKVNIFDEMQNCLDGTIFPYPDYVKRCNPNVELSNDIV